MFELYTRNRFKKDCRFRKNDMECSVVYRCECNQRGYPSMTALKQHQKTKQHLAWVERNELRLLKVELTEKTNLIVALNNKIDLLRDLNNTLIKRITVE